LDCNGPHHTPRPTLSNAVKILEKDPIFTGLVWYDEFLDRILTGQPAREWHDADDLNLTVDLQDRLGLSIIAVRTVADAVQQVAHRRPRHVVRDWLTTLVWDGEQRIDYAFEDHWGVECGAPLPCEYVRAASRNFFIGLIARVFKPGCQLDTMVVFEGDQGIKKTSALRVLGGDWYGLSSESVSRKDFFEGLQGKWIVELGELDGFSRAEVTRVKTVISTPVDRYRPSYGRTARDYPRQCVFCGTTNRDDWGNDETGLRRFWPIRCGDINTTTLADARDWLLAEAMVRYREGQSWWDMPISAREVQAARQADDPWLDRIADGLALIRETTMASVLSNVLTLDVRDQTLNTEKRVGRILRLLGWNKRNLRRNGVQGKMWVANANEVAER
jgi:putative DNA primase/helicase